MKSLLIISLIVSVPAWSCPNLAGKYLNCRSTTGQMDAPANLEITQSTNRGITTYTTVSVDPTTQERETDTFRADGRTYTQTATDPDTGITFTQATTASCSGEVLNLNQNVTVQGEAFALLKMNLSKKNNELTQRVTGSSMGQNVEDTIICNP